MMVKSKLMERLLLFHMDINYIVQNEASDLKRIQIGKSPVVHVSQTVTRVTRTLGLSSIFCYIYAKEREIHALLTAGLLKGRSCSVGLPN